MVPDVAALLRSHIIEIAAGTVFLGAGLAVCAIAAIGRRSNVRVFIWLGIWSAMYGAGRLTPSPAILTASPHWFRLAAPYLNTIKVVRQLNRVLSSVLRGRLVSAAYLWLDTQGRTMRYSAADHPPLLRWSGGVLQPIESNGVLFGILPDCEYPVVAADLAFGTGSSFTPTG